MLIEALGYLKASSFFELGVVVHEADGGVGKMFFLGFRGYLVELLLIGLVDVLVNDVYLPVVLTEEVVLGFIDRADDDFLGLCKLDELEEGNLLVKAVDLASKGPLLLFLILNCRLLVHQPLEDLLPHFALLIQKGQKLVPRDGLLDECLRDAALDVGRRASLE